MTAQMQIDEVAVKRSRLDQIHAEIARLRAERDALRERAERAEGRCDELASLIRRIEPHIDAIVCYASTMGEHEPNRIAYEVRSIASGGLPCAAETGWLIELKGNVPSWAILNPRDYDEHWTTDSTKALRFARKADAEAFIAWHGWTEAFASEHVWDDGARQALSTLGGNDDR